MLKSLTLLLSFLLCFSTLSSQTNIFEPGDNLEYISPLSLDGTAISIDENLLYNINSRSNIRAVIDTFQRFGLTNGAFRQTTESHYYYDSNYNQVLRRNLNYSSITDQLSLASETIVVYTDNLLTSDTTYLYIANTAERIPGTRRQLSYDDNGEWYDIREDKWDNNLQTWVPDTKIVLEHDGNTTSRIRSIWNSVSSDYSVNRVEVWEYDDQGGNIRYEQANLFMDSLRLSILITRVFNDNGDLTDLFQYTASAPDFNLRPFMRSELFYDSLGRNWKFISYAQNLVGPEEWRFSVQRISEFNENNLVANLIVDNWNTFINEWVQDRRIVYEYDSFGNIIFTSEYKPIGGLPDAWVLDRTVEQTFDTNFEVGSFVPGSGVGPYNYMITNQTIKTYNPDESTNTIQYWIYREVLPNSLKDENFYPIQVYPNPFDSNITIDLKDLNVQVSTVEIYNSTGVLCLSRQLNQNAELQVAHLIPGTYLLILKDLNGNVLSSKKMIKR